MAWTDFFKLFWYAMKSPPPEHRGCGICCGPFIPDIRPTKMYYVIAASSLQTKIEKLLAEFFDGKAEIGRRSDGKLYIKFKEDAGFQRKEDRLSEEEIQRGVCGGGIVEGLDGKTFCIEMHEIKNCQHPNAYYYGDTNPPTYKCPDCGATFINA